MKKGMLLVWVLLLSGSFAAEKVTFDNNWSDYPLFNVVSETPSGIEVIFSIHEMVVEEMDIDGMPMKIFGVPGIFLPNDEGAPNLAGTGRYIAIPQGAQARVMILDVRKEVYNNIEVAPAPIIPLDIDDSPLRYVKDTEIYDQDAYYPETPVRLSEPMQMRGVDVVILGITPFQYNPVTKELIVYKDIRVKVDFIGGNGHYGEDRLRSRFWEPILQGNLLNYGSLPEIDFYSMERIKDVQDGTGYEYIIIVPDDPLFEAWADTIKNWRQLQGISSEVFTLTEVGGSTEDDIKDFLWDAYHTWDPAPVAFLLLSDYPSSGDVYGITSKSYPHPYSGWYVTDNWYAEMGAGAAPVMDCARICAQTEAQLSTMVNKFLSYERNPYTASNFYDEPLMACAWQTERWFQLCGEVVRGFFVNSQGKAPARQYAIYSGSPTPGCAWSTAPNTATVVSYWSGLGYIPATNQHDASWWSNGSSTGITNAINSGAFLVMHRDHGNELGWGEPSYNTGHLNNLTNTMFTHVYSMNCLTGRYDYAGECFTEKFHRIDYGALGLNAASQISYSFVNDVLDWGCCDGLWSEFDPGYPFFDMTGHNNLRPCQALTYGKYYLLASNWPYNSGSKAITCRLFHHHGDAFNVLYSEIPQNLAVSHAATLSAGATSFTVTADDSSVIALTVNYEIIGVAQGTGSPLAIPIIQQVPGNTMKVTVTKANYYRYEVDVPIISASGPYPIATTTIIDDAGGNNDGEVNPGEVIDYGIYLRNVGDETALSVYAYLLEESPYITVNIDSSWYGNIAVDDSVLSAPFYNFTVADNCPNNHTIICSLAIYDNSKGLYVSYPTFTVYAPVLIYKDKTVVDGGNGRLDPGETADLVVTIRNSGGAIAQNITSILETSSPYITINDNSGNFGSLDPGHIGDNSGDPYNVTASSSTEGGTIVDFSIIVQSGVYCDTLEFSLTVGITQGIPCEPTCSGYVAAENDQKYPKIAFGTTNYLVVWHDSRQAQYYFGPPRDIYATRVTLAGEVMDTCGICISDVASGRNSEPGVAFDGTNYLVVWIQEAEDLYYDLYGARVTQAGVVLDPGGFLIVDGTAGSIRIPAVGFNGTNYLVAYSGNIEVGKDPDSCGAQIEYDSHDARINYDLFGVRVAPDGTILDPGGFLINGGANYETYATIVSNGSDWFVAWQDDASSTDWIRGARIASDGTVLDPGGILISSGANDRIWPDAAFDGTNYFVVWQDRRSGTALEDWAIYGARITQEGTVLDPAGIVFANDPAETEVMPGACFNGTNYLVIWKDEHFGAFAELAGRRMTPEGVMLEPAFPISGGYAFEQFPNLVSDGSTWLTVWDDNRYGSGVRTSGDASSHGKGSDIIGARVDSSGVVLDPYPNDINISLVGNWQYSPCAAFDGTNYLVVWQEKKGIVNWDIYGTRVSASGTVLDIPTLAISTEENHQTIPDIAFGNANYLVVWVSHTITGSGLGVYGARVGLDGTVLDPGGFVITGNSVRYLAVAFDGTNYVVVWWEYYNGNYHIFGARVTQDGVVLDPGGFDIATATHLSGWNSHVTVSLAFDGTNYLVIWPDGYNGNYDIYGARFTPDGIPLDPPNGFPVAKLAGSDQDHSDLTYGEGKYFAVWRDNRAGGNEDDIYGTFIDTSGVSYDTSGIAIATAGGNVFEPCVCFIGSKYIVTWTDYRNDVDIPDLYGARLDLDGTLLDPDGFDVSTIDYRQFDPSVTPGPSGRVFFAYSSFTNDSPFGASRAYFQQKTIEPDVVPPSAPYIRAEKSCAAENSVVLTWNKITADTLGNTEVMGHYVVYRSTSPSFVPGTSDSISAVSHPDTTYTDADVLNDLESYYYLVKAVDKAMNRSTKSNMGYKLNKFVNENAGATGDRNWVSLPWYGEYDSVPDLTADLSPSGNPLTKITDLRDDQVFQNWIHHPVLGWYGDTFDISAGRAYEMIANADDTVFLVGSNDPTGFIPLNENPDALGDRNWVSIPYNAVYDRAIDITNEYSSGGEAVIKITNLRNDQIFENWIYHPVLGWYGDTFAITAGRGYEFVAVLDTVWNPTEYTNETDKGGLLAHQEKSDIKVHLGTLTKADRAPLWVVDEDVSDKTVSRADIEDRKKEVCLSEPKSKKISRSTDEYNTRVYRPVSRSVSAKKNLELCREAGVSHLVRAEFDAGEFSDLVFTAYRLTKPYDVLTENVIGGGIAQKHDLGVLWFDVGNFMRPWKHGEEVILIIEALHEHGAYCQVIRFKLDQGIDIQELGKLELESMPKPEPVSNAAVSWSKSENVQVIGYSVYQGDIRTNNEVIRTKEYSGGKDITLKLVIKGGYETVYNSGSKRSEYGPVVELPRVYAFTVYPNPFIKKTMINYALPEPGQVSIMVYDVTGRKVMTLVNGRVDPGYYQMHWSGCDDLGRQISAGVYFMRMNTPGFTSQQKVIFVR